MIELVLLSGGRKKAIIGEPLPDVEVLNPLPNIPNRSIRMYCVAAARTQVGINEIWMYERGTGLEYMHSGAVVEARFSYDFSKDGFGPYTPNLTYDGDSTNWRSSAYIDLAPNRDKFLQWNFNRDVDISSWVMKAEATWYPQNDGLELYMFTGSGWTNITGTQQYPWREGLINTYVL